MNSNVKHNKILVMVVDNDARARRALSALLRTYPQIGVIAEAGDGVQAVELASGCHPEVIVMDGIMPRLDGIGAVREIKRTSPQTAILLLSLYGELEWDALKAGADAFLVKSASAEEIVDTITRLGRRGVAGLSSNQSTIGQGVSP